MSAVCVFVVSRIFHGSISIVGQSSHARDKIETNSTHYALKKWQVAAPAAVSWVHVVRLSASALGRNDAGGTEQFKLLFIRQ